MEVVIDRRFNGPPRSANGGYACGTAAAQLGDAPGVVVTLRSPPPLGRPMQAVTREGHAALQDGDTLVAEADVVEPLDLTPPWIPGRAAATDAVDRYVGWDEHPFPTCFVCGPDRAAGDGLRIFPGRVDPDDPDGVHAAPWLPDPSLDRGDGTVDQVFVWSALDCPTYFAVGEGEIPALLARLQVQHTAPVIIGREHLVLSWPLGSEGRRHRGAAAVVTTDADVVAIASALWIELDPDAFARFT